MAEWMPAHKYVLTPSTQRESRPTLLLERCEAMAREGRLREAFRLFAEAFGQGKVEKRQLKSLTAALVKFQMNKMEQEMFLENSKEESEEVLQPMEEILTCSACKALFMEPITLPCGHSFCKFCLRDDFTTELCTICGATDPDETKIPTFLFSNLILKWFPKKHALGVKKVEGRTCMTQGKYNQAIEIFSLILAEELKDVNCFCWRAECYSFLGTLELALKDIDLACSLLPNSVRLLLRKARILSAMGDREQAISTLLRCTALEPQNTKLREELESGLYELFRLDFSNIKESVFTPMNFFSTEKKGISMSSYDCDSDQTNDDVIMCDRNSDDENCTTDKCDMELGLHKEEKTEFDASGCEKEPISEASRSIATLDRCQDKVLQSKSHRDPLMDDFECKLCCSLLYKPVTSPCGHNFCRDCLRRSLDYRLDCPCCRSPLAKYLAERRENTTMVLERIIKHLFPKEYEKRDQNYTQEMLALKRSVEDSEFEVPIFICTLAFPSVPCPLHIFEPRYKLMIRRCIESGLKQFGMCVSSEDSTFPTMGTILKIKEVVYLPDGRSLVNTIGTRRFQVLSHCLKDGYNVAKAKWLVDEVEDDEEEREEIQKLHRNGFKMLEFWFNQLTSEQQDCITNAIGNMPKQEKLDPSKCDQPSWLWWALAALPLQDKPKLIILAMTSVVERLRSIMRFLMLMIKMQQRNGKQK